MELTKGIGFAHTSLIRSFILQGKVENAAEHYYRIKGSIWDKGPRESLKSILIRQLSTMEDAKVFETGNPYVEDFRAFLDTMNKVKN